MRSPARTALAGCLALLVMGAPAAGAGDRVVARVGREPVTRNEIQTARATLGDVSYEEARTAVVDRKLVLNWAVQQDMEVGEDELDAVVEDLAAKNQLTREQFEAALKDQGQSMAAFRDALRDQLLINKAMAAALSERMLIGEEEIRRVYAERYRPVSVHRVSHILFSVEPDADAAVTEETRTRALDVLARIEAGEPFAEMARAFSEDTSSAAGGGTLGAFRQGELLAEIEEALTELSPGDTAGPVRTRLGYHIIRLDSREESQPPPLEEIREELRRSLIADRELSVRSAWIEELRENTYIEFFEP